MVSEAVVVSATVASAVVLVVAVGRLQCCARGTELGQILACLVDETSWCVLVDKPALLSTLSSHSSRWSMSAPTRDLWHMRQVLACVAWKFDQEEVTAIIM